MPKAKAKPRAKKRKKPAAADMSTAEAAVATLIGHGLDTIYALPGIHNDHLFDAFQRAGDRLRLVHTRHEQGAAYMALGAALATGKPQAYVVVPGPGLLNSGAALLTAYGMNAPVLAVIGQIPAGAIGKGQGHLHEIRDQAGIIARLVDHSSHIRGPGEASVKVAKAIASMSQGRPGPAAIECAIDVWGKRGPVSAIVPPSAVRAPKIDNDKVRAAAKLLGKVQTRPDRRRWRCAGCLSRGDAALEHVAGACSGLSARARRARFAQSAERDAAARPRIVGGGRCGSRGRHATAQSDHGNGASTKVCRSCASMPIPRSQRGCTSPNVALIGDAAPILRQLIDSLAKFNTRRASRHDEMLGRQANLRERLTKLAPQLAFLEAIRAELPEDGIYVDEVTQVGFAARLAFPVYKPRTFLSPGYQDNLGWGYASALGAQHARPDVPVLSINGDGGFLYTGNELATAIRHRIPLVAVIFVDGAFGNVRRIQQEQFGNRLIACDLANPDFVKYAESFGAAGRRARGPDELRLALQESFARREPTLIEVPVAAMPSPWEFIQMPRVRGL